MDLTLSFRHLQNNPPALVPQACIFAFRAKNCALLKRLSVHKFGTRLFIFMISLSYCRRTLPPTMYCEFLSPTRRASWLSASISAPQNGLRITTEMCFVARQIENGGPLKIRRYRPFPTITSSTPSRSRTALHIYRCALLTN